MMNSSEQQAYDLGRQARISEYAISACNISASSPMRSWWIAGWHDADMELLARGAFAENETEQD